MSVTEKRSGFDVAAKSHQEWMLNELAAGKPLNEDMVLRTLAALVMAGSEIDPNLQSLANAIVSKAVVAGRLPSARSRGRPKGSEKGNSAEMWADFYDVLDSAVDAGKICTEAEAEAYATEAYEQVADKHEVDVRTVKRMVERENGSFFGSANTKAMRDQLRRTADFSGKDWNRVNIEYEAGMVHVDGRVIDPAKEPPSFFHRSIPEAVELLEQKKDQAVAKIRSKK